MPFERFAKDRPPSKSLFLSSGISVLNEILSPNAIFSNQVGFSAGSLCAIVPDMATQHYTKFISHFLNAPTAPNKPNITISTYNTKHFLQNGGIATKAIPKDEEKAGFQNTENNNEKPIFKKNGNFPEFNGVLTFSNKPLSADFPTFFKSELEAFSTQNNMQVENGSLDHCNKHFCNLLMEYDSLKTVSLKILWKVLFVLRGFARTTNSLVFVPIPPECLDNPLRHVADYILQIKSFAGDFGCENPKSEYGDFDGILNLTKSPFQVKGDNSFLYRARSARLVVERFSLPPESLRDDQSEKRVEDEEQ